MPSLFQHDDTGRTVLDESQRYFPFLGLVPVVWAVAAGADDLVFLATAMGVAVGVMGTIAIIVQRQHSRDAGGYMVGTAFALSTVLYLLFILATQPTPRPGEDF